MFLKNSIYAGEKIDVLIPIYKSRKEFLISSLNSVLNQKIRSRIICILNGMTHQENLYYVKLLEEFRCDILISPKKGIANALNYSINFTRAPFIARQDDDDISHQDRFLIQKKFLAQDSCDVVGTNIFLIDEQEKLIGKRQYPESDYECKKQLIFKTCFCHPTVMMKRNFLLNNYYPDLSSEDYALWISASKNNIYKNLSTELYFYRRHSKQYSKKKNISYLYLRTSLILLSNNKSKKDLIASSFKLITQIILCILKGREIDFKVRLI